MILRDKYFGGATDSGAIRVDYNSILQQLGISIPSTGIMELEHIWQINAKQFASGIYLFLFPVPISRCFFLKKRREAGNCRICWWADTPADDVDIGGKKTKGYVKVITKGHHYFLAIQ